VPPRGSRGRCSLPSKDYRLARRTKLAACSYEVDAELTIVAVDAAWSEFARKNEARELLPPRPLGRPLLSYVADRSTAHLYQQLFERVRLTGDPLRVPFRCDAPGLRRFLELRVAPRAGGGFHLASALLRAERRSPVPLLDRLRPRGEDHLLMCSWCKRVAVAERWAEVEVAVAALRLFEKELMPEITHGICPGCRNDIERLLGS
jgi:hypothetical protein